MFNVIKNITCTNLFHLKVPYISTIVQVYITVYDPILNSNAFLLHHFAI